MLLIKIILFSIAIFQGIVIGLLLLKSPFFKSKSSQFLAYALFSASWILLDTILDISNAYKLYPYLKIVETLDALLLFPTFILLFVMHQVKSPNRKSKRKYWLFAPTFLVIVLLILLSFFPENFENINENDILIIFLIVSLLFIIILSFIPYSLIKTYKYIKLSQYKQEKQWLLRLWKFEVFILVMVMLLFITSPFLADKIESTIQLIALFGTFFIHWIAYSGVYKLRLKSDREKVRALLTDKVFNTNKLEETKEKSFRTKSNEYNTNNEVVTKGSTTFSPSINSNLELDKQEVNPNLSKDNIYFKKLESLCLNEKIYRDNTLDRNKVAEMLDISPNYFSQIINSETGNNFTTYINRYRVEDVKTFIQNEDFENYSLLAIGLECGFSSKSAFHNSFKKITGMTPNAYKNMLK